MEVSNIDDLPEEVFEFILSLLPPYKDLHDCMLVCKKWRRCVLNVVKAKQRNLYKAINEFDIRWTKITPVEMAPTITKRYSHNAVVYENSMYIFGGCTCAMTTFNDLWRLDLSKRQWIRPLAMGTYPSPKACSSMAVYKNTLILFGGWAYPPSYPLYSSWHLFNELHVYDITGNVWTCVVSLSPPPPTAGHSVSIIGDWMIVFGGLQKPNHTIHCEKSNDIWKLNLKTWTWYKQDVEKGPKPHGRFNQSQIVIDDKNILILGGSGGPSSYFGDAWLLNMSNDLWKWIRVEIKEKSNEPSNVWSNPGCRIGDKVVVLNRIKQPENDSIKYYPKSAWSDQSRDPTEDGRLARIDLANRNSDKDENINGKRGTLKNQKREAEDVSPSTSKNPNTINIGVERNSLDNIVLHNMQNNIGNMSAFNGPPEPRKSRETERLREKRIASLMKVKENFIKTNKKDKKTHYLGIYVLDISQVLSKEPSATWLHPKHLNNGPEETILYSLVEGKSELIMFGGIQKDACSLSLSLNLSSQISNSLHFITAPNNVI